MIVFLPSEVDLSRVISHITVSDKEINLGVRGEKHTPNRVEMPVYVSFSFWQTYWKAKMADDS